MGIKHWAAIAARGSEGVNRKKNCSAVPYFLTTNVSNDYTQLPKLDVEKLRYVGSWPQCLREKCSAENAEKGV